MNINRLLAICALAIPVAVAGQGLDPALLLKPPTDAWPTYNGDYSGRRFSTLDQINQSNVKNLSLAWIYRASAGANSPRTIVGGEGPESKEGGGASGAFGGVSIKATPLMVNGILYFATPDNAWAVDARSGRELWHYFWKTQGGIHIGNRGVGMYENWLFFETPDNYLVSLDARTGKERWHKQIADVKQEYFSTPAPVVVGNHVLVGTGGDSLDVPGFLEAHDPETGEIQWKWWSEPLKKGDPGSETWPDEYSMRHGGGMTWIPGTYDPELHLYYLGTGNPNPSKPVTAAKATISGPAPSWPLTSIPGRWHGITRCRRTILTIGMPCRRPSLLTASSTANLVNCWRKPAATDTFFCSTVPTVSIC